MYIFLTWWLLPFPVFLCLPFSVFRHFFSKRFSAIPFSPFGNGIFRQNGFLPFRFLRAPMRRAADAAVYTAARNSDIKCSSLSPLFLSTNLVGWLYYNSVFFICQYFFWLFHAFFERFNYRLTEVEHASVLKAGFRPCRIRNLANTSSLRRGLCLAWAKISSDKTELYPATEIFD